jgi:hypothetical protein
MIGNASSSGAEAAQAAQPAAMWMSGIVCLSVMVASLVLLGWLSAAQLPLLRMVAYFVAPVAAICLSAWVFYDHNKRAMLVQEERRLIGYGFLAHWMAYGSIPFIVSLRDPKEGLITDIMSALALMLVAVVVSCIGVFIATHIFGKPYVVRAVA